MDFGQFLPRETIFVTSFLYSCLPYPVGKGTGKKEKKRASSFLLRQILSTKRTKKLVYRVAALASISILFNPTVLRMAKTPLSVKDIKLPGDIVTL